VYAHAAACEVLSNTNANKTPIMTIVSGCELFLSFAGRSSERKAAGLNCFLEISSRYN
jgi:hypothetical protein